jgi:hypothetical protein
MDAIRRRSECLHEYLEASISLIWQTYTNYFQVVVLPGLNVILSRLTRLDASWCKLLPLNISVSSELDSK